MTKHTSYRGVTIDMDAFRRENEKTTALGNMNVNAKGDLIKGGSVVKTADQLAREQHHTKTSVIKGSLKGPEPKSNDSGLETQLIQKSSDSKPPMLDKEKSNKSKKMKQVELPSGDIVMQEDDSENQSTKE